jgi:hypothetical protein
LKSGDTAGFHFDLKSIVRFYVWLTFWILFSSIFFQTQLQESQLEESHHEIKIEIKLQLVAAIKTQTEFLWE